MQGHVFETLVLSKKKKKGREGRKEGKNKGRRERLKHN
jgi:hypothetical protein